MIGPFRYMRKGPYFYYYPDTIFLNELFRLPLDKGFDSDYNEYKLNE